MTREELDKIKNHISNIPAVAALYVPELIAGLEEERALKQHWAADADAKEALLQSVARVCRGAKEPDQADLSVLGNVLRERDEARAEAARLKEHLRHIAYEHCDSPVHYAMNQLED